ncbi:uncharacterized protein Dana_GF10521 [Drosophila ananassae]|uniref:NTF2 domain-containing protein n=1 Tax=Drosophila ananassae TaxID=7217 RepID=B3M4H0_DROAN|nr:nuclear RNA export factor 2 [Drosophila ananassae]XP_032310130.1 nuclear RNA export factor 2 [Drosophila ananassae]XP_032310131.1 nuclear RNA export factor 2 [Drosophila ananassae]XP_044570495.1 nuclear RNA export factor 2 [Drosophila ananassae]EDV40464.1 uncharacterized protein Dana_GF10521 [Drosophila ananassae]
MRVLDFADGSVPICLEYPDGRVFRKCSSYGDRVPGLNWVEFTLYHDGGLEFMEDRRQILLEAIYEVVDGANFFPVYYQLGGRVDTFLARDCKKALDRLFLQKLTINLGHGISIGIGVQMGVARYITNQITPTYIIAEKLSELIKRLVKRDGVGGLLNLESFGSHPEFRNIVVSLANPSIFTTVCQVIRNDPDSYRVRGYILSKNRIRCLKPLSLFANNPSIELLDLSENRIASAERFCNEMAHFQAKELLLTKNPIEKNSKFPENIKALEKNFTLVNGVAFDKLHRDYCPLDNDIDLEADGTRIDGSNIWKLMEFKDSKDWHALCVSDPFHEYQKDALFDFVFISVDANLSEFYPCYYKYIRREHVFLVRNCFDQIVHLTNIRGMKIVVPPMLDLGERLLNFYLRMNVSVFKDHHLEPHKCIVKAVKESYPAQNRLLDLSQFQANKNLENVVVHMSSPKVLTSVLLVASKQFMENCSEIRLCNNKIIQVYQVNFLTRMGNLRALDLRHNWLHDLSLIQPLEVLPLKSLLLHGNPLCRNYAMASEYVRAVKEIFPQLTTLDGVELQANPGQTPQKNFLCYIGAYELVGDVFLSNYLREFEKARESLLKYYSDDSIFTMTCSYRIVQNQRTGATGQLLRRLSQYNSNARNLHQLDNSKATNFVFVGGMEIVELLLKLPKVTHDFHSLQTDVMHYDGKSAIIYVTGLLRDEAAGSFRGDDLFLAFSRQFVVKLEDDGLGLGKSARRLKITNERFNIMNPSKTMVRNAFKVSHLTHDKILDHKSELDVKDHKLLLFQEVTGLISTWCTSIVEAAEWDFEEALKLFLKKNEANEIPDIAFS